MIAVAKEIRLRRDMVAIAQQRNEAEARLRVARFVATYWRDAFMQLDGAARVGSHPLAMVLAALDGETEPKELGISEDEWPAFRAVVGAP